MYRMLLDREYGVVDPGLSVLLSERWRNLRATPSRELRTLFATSFSFLSIATPTASLLLCGGTGTQPRNGTSCGAVGVFRLAAPDEKVNPQPLVFAADAVTLPDDLECGKWMPGDPGLFLTGGSAGKVFVWDTEVFKPVLSLPGVGEDGRIVAVDMSAVPSGRSELVATAWAEGSGVALLDLNTGGFTHRLGEEVGAVRDVAWSPTHPYMLAVSGKEGAVRVYDVRRAGNMACLVEFNQFRRLPDAGQTRRQFARRGDSGVDRKRRRKVGGVEATVEERAELLGLGCAWEGAAAPQERRRKRRAEARGRVRAGAGTGAMRIRFAPDGMTLVSGGRDGYFRMWDVHTGRLIAAMSQVEGGRERTTVFEVAGDGNHLLANANGGLRTYGINEGTLFPLRRGHYGEMSSLTVHPFYEEAYSACMDHIICWAPPQDAPPAGTQKAR